MEQIFSVFHTQHACTHTSMCIFIVVWKPAAMTQQFFRRILQALKGAVSSGHTWPSCRNRSDLTALIPSRPVWVKLHHGGSHSMPSHDFQCRQVQLHGPTLRLDQNEPLLTTGARRGTKHRSHLLSLVGVSSLSLCTQLFSEDKWRCGSSHGITPLIVCRGIFQPWKPLQTWTNQNDRKAAASRLRLRKTTSSYDLRSPTDTEIQQKQTVESIFCSVLLFSIISQSKKWQDFL